MKLFNYSRINKFVYSLELEQYVALAETKENTLVLIDVFGNVLETLNNE